MEGSNKKTPIVVIAGATAAGKSGTAVELCRKIGGEIISADSMQIYRGLDIGTAKTVGNEQKGIVHHLLDIRDPDEDFSAADFVNAAKPVIADIVERGLVPVVCGGTGFYIDSLVKGTKFEDDEKNEYVRTVLKDECAIRGLGSMYSELLELDSVYAGKISPNDEKRILRALEIIRGTGITPTERLEKMSASESEYDCLYFILLARDRSLLYEKIEKRIDEMVEEGILAEAEEVYAHRDTYKTAVQAIGYKEFFPYIERTGTLEECKDELKKDTRHFAKRQYSWFKRVQNGIIYYVDEMSRDEIVSDMADRIAKEFNN